MSANLDVDNRTDKLIKAMATKLRQLEERYAKYLYKKIIEPELASSGDELESSGEEPILCTGLLAKCKGTGVNGTESTPPVEERATPNPVADSSQNRRNRYMDVMFIKRKQFTQKELLDQELANLKLADALYTENPEHYPDCKTEYGYPSSYRCNFINYHKHKLTRCTAKICDESDYFCIKHYLLDNKLYTNYIQLVGQAANPASAAASSHPAK